MLVTFPFVLLLLDYWPLRRLQWPLRWPDARPVLIEKAPLLLLSLAASVLTFQAQHQYGAVASLEHLPLAIRLANAAIAYVAYIGQAIWPANLGVLYPGSPPATYNTVLALFILAAATVVSLLYARKRPYLLTGWLWYVGMLVPVIGIVQVGVQSRADRYMYVPLVGLTVAIVWAAADWLESRPALQGAAAIAAGVLLLVFAAGTWRQTSYWKDSRTLFEHTLAVTSGNYVIRNNLGVTFASAQDLKGAIDQYRQAIAINPTYAEAHGNLGHSLLRTGEFQPARTELLEALRLKPDFALAHADLGVYEAAGGNYPEAIRHLNDSLRIAPSDADAHSNLCFVPQHAGRVDEAISHCKEALRIKPEHKDAQFNLKNALAVRK